MSTWAIGDVQGCGAPLRALLARLKLGPSDRVWFAGDLVNRGPDSLGVLRLVRDLGDQAVAVLGNHDLYLLARAGGRRAKKRDTLDAVLAAPDGPALVDWVRARPLLHREGAWVMVHAGFDPRWTLLEAQQRARAAEAALQGPEGLQQAMPKRGRLAETLAGLTRVRMVHADGKLDEAYKGPPGEAPAELAPWWTQSGVPGPVTVVFGHWAALGLYQAPGLLALDTGCVWGGALTAVCLEDGRVVQQPA
jgi:bis(5'-nucleosyl)-tetraphosphatase (symmetrical)